MDNKKRGQNYSNTDGFLHQSPKVQTPHHESLDHLAQFPIIDPLQTSSAPLPQPTLPKYSYDNMPTPGPVQLADTPKKNRARWSRKRKIVTSMLTILLIGFGVGTYFGSRIIGNVDKVFHGNVFSDVNAFFVNTKLKGEDQGRVNILLAGDSADDPNHGGAQLTDSIMVVSIDTKNHTGFMLSIPRDLWVDIPGWSHQKINAANDVNNFNQPGYPSNGMGQLEQIIQTDLGIPIDYYSLIDYSAFKDAVDTVGGITVNIQSPDPRGLFDPNISVADGGPLLLKNGVQTLNGQTALNLARARGDPCYCNQVEYGFPQSDYDRTQHQRQMLTALAQKAQTLGVIANPIKVSSLFDAFGKNIETDLSLQDVIRLMQITKGMKLPSLQSLELSNTGPKALLEDYLAPDGEEALIPTAGIDNFGQIQQYYQQLTTNNPVVREAPTVVVLNGSNISGIAHQQATILQAKGFDVVGVTDAEAVYPSSLVIDLSNNQKPASSQLLSQLYTGKATISTGISSTAEANEAKGYNADFVVILGQDWQSTQKSQPVSSN